MNRLIPFTVEFFISITLPIFSQTGNNYTGHPDIINCGVINIKRQAVIQTSLQLINLWVKLIFRLTEGDNFKQKDDAVK